MGGGLPYYTFDYVVESTRGFNHFVAKAAVTGQRLYVLTVQIKEGDYTQYQDLVQGIAQSFTVIPTTIANAK